MDEGTRRLVGSTVVGIGLGVTVAVALALGVAEGVAGRALLAWRTKAKMNTPRPTTNKADTNAPASSNIEGRR